MRELKQGEAIPLEDGGEAIVQNEIGSGGQGVVYRAAFAGRDYALKWYDPRKLKNPAAFRKNLADNIFGGPPSAAFLWPRKLTREKDGSFGYLMDLRPSGYVDFSAILNNQTQFSGLPAMLDAALNITHSFRELHRRGLSYQDINDGNFFINPQNGAVLICDNDNVAPDNAVTGIGGKPGYMAPEVVRGETPGTLSDYHSLAVVLFKLLMRHDPLMGRAFVDKVCITEAAEQELYGDKPVFIFDPDNPSNRPVPGVHPNPLYLWPLYPQHLRDIFVQAFCPGMTNPNARPADNDWLRELVRLRGEIIACNCGREVFAGAVRDTVRNHRFRCPGCDAEISFPLALQAGKQEVYLFPGSRVYRCHTETDCDDYATVTGQVVRNKKNPGIWALRNLSDQVWQATTPKGTMAVAKDAVAPVAPDIVIEFGGASGRITRNDA